MYNQYSNSLSEKKNQMCTYFFYKDCCKFGCFYFTGFKWKEVAQVSLAPKGTLGDQQHLLPGALHLLVFFVHLFIS